MEQLKEVRLESFAKIIADVLSKVPKDASPVFALLPEVWASTQMIAPEKTDTLLKLLREIKLYPKTAAFRFSTSGTYLHISEGALNLIWCASYTSWFIYQAFANPGENVRFDSDPATAEAVDLYEWAIKAVRTNIYTPWPEGAPKPTRTPVRGSESHVANEVFLTTVAWMLLHEHGHLFREHPMTSPTVALAEEHEADLFATNHVLGGIEEYDVRFKRSVGIVVANVLLLLLDLDHGPDPSPTHPPVEERISRNLRGPELGDDDRIHAFATALILFHLRIFGIQPELAQHDQFGNFLDDFCFAINRWRRPA